MNRPLPLLSDDDVSCCLNGIESDTAGFGALMTDRGPLPLKSMDVRGRIDGLLSQVTLSQTFVNTLDQPIEATYIFPLPDRAALTSFRMEVAGRVVDGVLKERGQARQTYDKAIADGHRASIAEEERPGVFTLRVGNLMPGDQATVRLTLAGPLPYSDGEVTFRFPLVVAPRYIPGMPLSGPSVGDGVAQDTDAVPDASRISPPVLLSGYPNPVRLSISVDIHTDAVPIGAIRSSLHAAQEETSDGVHRISLQAGERLNRDFILRFRLGSDSLLSAFSVHPDPDGDGSTGTFALTSIPPTGIEHGLKPRDVVFLLDRSGSMDGWKMVAARRALARMVDSLTDRDRFLVCAFDNVIETPPGLGGTRLHAATDRNRFRAVGFLGELHSRGGTEMAQPLAAAVQMLAVSPPERERILVLVTDGQVGNEDQILREIGSRLKGIRVFALGIDQAVNAAFLRRLADLGNGGCELVESEDRLDAVMDAVHRRIGTPVLTGIRIESDDMSILTDTLVPGRMPDLFAGAPMLLMGRYEGKPQGTITLHAVDPAGEPWHDTIMASVRDNPAIGAVWARGRVRELEDRYILAGAGAGSVSEAIERQIVATSLAFGVLSRFTAYVAVDSAEVANAGGELHYITQPVETPDGWGQLAHSAVAKGAYGAMMPSLRSRAPMASRSSGGFASASAPGAVPGPAELEDRLGCVYSFSAPEPASASPPSQADAAVELPDACGEVPGPARAMDKGVWARVFRLIRQWIARGALPEFFDIRECRHVAQTLASRIKEVMAAQGNPSARLRPLRSVARDLGHLLDALRLLSPTPPELPSLAEVHQALNTVLAASPTDPLAVLEVSSRAKDALGAFSSGPSGVSEPERRGAFWKK